ncbi:hypothetical protein SSS_00805 [Sarcoptes scabiei]|nr:hypothetical protein SSS_00805 [Sarcoptes scabiei]
MQLYLFHNIPLSYSNYIPVIKHEFRWCNVFLQSEKFASLLSFPFVFDLVLLLSLIRTLSISLLSPSRFSFNFLLTKKNEISFKIYKNFNKFIIVICYLQQKFTKI